MSKKGTTSNKGVTTAMQERINSLSMDIVLENLLYCGYLLHFCKLAGTGDYIQAILAIRRYYNMFDTDTNVWTTSWQKIDEDCGLLSDETSSWPRGSRVVKSQVSLVAHDIYSSFVSPEGSDQILMPPCIISRTKRRLGKIHLYGPYVFCECEDRLLQVLSILYPRFRRSPQFDALVVVAETSSDTLPCLHSSSLEHYQQIGSIDCPLGVFCPQKAMGSCRRKGEACGRKGSRDTRLPKLPAPLSPSSSSSSSLSSSSSKASLHSSCPADDPPSPLDAHRLFTLKDVLANPFLQEKFLRFLERRYCSENLHCYLMICEFEALVTSDAGQRNGGYDMGRLIYQYCIAEGSVWEVNIRSDVKCSLLLKMACPDRHMFSVVKKSLYETLRLEFQVYTKTPQYSQLAQLLLDYHDSLLANKGFIASCIPGAGRKGTKEWVLSLPYLNPCS